MTKHGHRVIGLLGLAGLAWNCAPCALAQDLEPAVRTSSSATEPATPAPTPPGAAVPQTTAPKAAANPPKAPTGVPSGKAKTGDAAATPAPGKDRIELETTEISGNRELPKVMYIVPWRRADLGDFAGRPPNSLLDEALTPVDRDVFRRQNRYYAALQNGSNGGAPNSAKPETGHPEAVPPAGPAAPVAPPVSQPSSQDEK